MIKKLLIVLLFTNTFLLSNETETNNFKDTFTEDIKSEFNEDFDIWGVKFNPQKSTIRFSKSDLMYMPGSSEMQISFEVILKDFYPRYLEFLLNYKDSIEEVIVIGHTSSENSKAKTKDGKYLRNLVLSQDRASVVLNYIKSLNDEVVVDNIDWINEKFRSVGLSSSKPILDNNGKENKSLSRRIEIQVKFNKSVTNLDNKSNEIKKVKKTKLLSTYVQQLLVENPTLNEQYQILSSIKQDIKIAQAAFKPTVTLNFSQTKYSQSNPDEQTDSRSEDVTVKYNLFNGYKDEQEEQISQKNYEITKLTKDQVVSDLIYTLAEAFVEIQRQKEILVIAKKNLDDYDNWIEKEKIRFQNGLISLKDYAKINSRDTTQRMNYQEMMRTYKDSVTTFEKYIDLDKKDIEIFEELDLTSVYFQNRKLSLDDAKVFSPYVKEAEENILLYKTKFTKAKVNFYPVVDLIAKKSQLNDKFKNQSSDKTEETTLKLEAKLELYSGGKDEAEYEKKLFEYRQKVQKRDEVLRDTAYKVNLAHNKYELVVVKEQFLNKLISQREESYIGANYDYKFAKIDANGLLDVVDDLYNARKQFIENKYDLILAKYKILSDVGIIRESILDE